MREKLNVGVIGCGKISDAYFKGCRVFEVLEVKACADLQMDAARAKAEEYGLRACSVDELLADPEVDLVVNLTIPQAHVPLSLRALEAGKHVFCEKPFALDRTEGKRVLEAAKKYGLRVGCAPDTFLGGGLQTSRKVIDDGLIGEPIAATAIMASHGPENWHPNPAFYYKSGGGPMFDMGPYYLTALIHLIGPIKRISGSARMNFKERTITSPARNGEKIEVEIPTHFSGVLDFQTGAIGTMLMSFDVWGHHCPCLEVHGTEASLSVPDPNMQGGEVHLRRAGKKEWEPIALTHTEENPWRGIGVADMALGILQNRPLRANGEMANHVVDAMQAFEESSKQGRHIELQSTCQRPAALPAGLKPGQLEL